MTALVLSGSYTETNRFAQQKKLGYGIRHVVSAANLEGRRPTSIHILPSYYDRRDIHAVKAAMKHVFRLNRHCPIVDYTLDPHTGVYHEQGASVVESADTTPSPTSAPESRLDALEALAADVDDVDVVEDTSKDAVPGQTAIEEHIEAVEHNHAPGVWCDDCPDATERQAAKDEYLAKLEAAGVIEPEGFELSDDPAVQAQQIIKSAAQAPDLDDDVPDWMK